jgi:hypothetical protein
LTYFFPSPSFLFFCLKDTKRVLTVEADIINRINITGLEEGIKYDVSIQAFVKSDGGPISPPVSHFTKESGEPCMVISSVTCLNPFHCFLSMMEHMVKIL